ncbi:MAG: VOC family protein [Flavobacteriales bacterium]|nr:VOC family protein [Flavobacteriales bacterium]
MFTAICPKLPMRSKSITRAYYVNGLGFAEFGADVPEYLMLSRDGFELHFFLYAALDPKLTYGQVYIRTVDIDGLYRWVIDRGVAIHPTGDLGNRPWGQREFALLDPDNNLLTFGQAV